MPTLLPRWFTGMASIINIPILRPSLYRHEVGNHIKFTRLHLGSLALRPISLSFRNSRPLIAQTPLLRTTKAYGQLLGRDFNPLAKLLLLRTPVPTDCKFMSVTISKNKCNQYFASVLVETEIIQKIKTGKSIGLDIGIKTFLSGSDGSTVENPKFLRDSQAKLTKAQRNLSRKKKGSARRKKAKLKTARIHTNIANKRKDFIHKETTRLVTEFDFIGIEDLNVAGMVKNHKLAKSISDASFSEFYSVLSYKAAWHGKEVIKIGRFYPSSKTCSCCGWKNDELTLSDRIFKCKSCNLEIDRDHNASINILEEALRVNSAIRTQSEHKSTQLLAA